MNPFLIAAGAAIVYGLIRKAKALASIDFQITGLTISKLDVLGNLIVANLKMRFINPSAQDASFQNLFFKIKKGEDLLGTTTIGTPQNIAPKTTTNITFPVNLTLTQVVKYGYELTTTGKLSGIVLEGTIRIADVEKYHTQQIDAIALPDFVQKLKNMFGSVFKK